MNTPNPEKSFTLYGETSGRISASQLRIISDCQAETADSGCEGTYCEVARWNERTQRWERFAFEKFFGNDEMSEYEEASMYTEYINRGSVSQGFVHSMSNYEE